MVLPRTKPLDGEFWYIIDDQNSIEWRPRPKLRGDFYLGWLGQNRNVVGAGLAWIQQGQLIHICTHGTPYYWLQPHAVLPPSIETMRMQQVQGADAMMCDYSLAGWEIRDQTLSTVNPWPDASVPADTLQPLFAEAVQVIVQNFRSESEPPPPPPKVSGLLARAETIRAAPPPDPLETLLAHLKRRLGEPNVAPILIEFVKHDLNLLPHYRTSGLFENLPVHEQLPAPSKVARLVISAVYHLGPLLSSLRLSQALLLNCLRQRHPFDVTWGADGLVRCLGMSNLIRLLQAAIVKEQDDQIRGNILDLLQELGYGTSAGLENEVLSGLTSLLDRGDLGAFSQVIDSHLAFLREYLRQRNDAAHLAN